MLRAPAVFGTDKAFLEAFDRHARDVAAGRRTDDIERLTQAAFDAATKSDANFMPFDWASVTALRDRSVAAWFRARMTELMNG